ncbi:hypothetical protein [Halobacteriovorax marinus]|uniref:hypothetical protein n=1 Tax=Halobacteriovorax marinus TaxID=97084 RepID=UPI003A9253AB
MRILLKVFTTSLLCWNLQAMCEYPHNPPAICVEGRVLSLKKTKNDKFPCELRVQLTKAYRPKNTYIFNDKLERVDFKDAKKLHNSVVSVYSKSSCHLKKIRALMEYNCNDREASFPDMALLDTGVLSQKIRDPWTEKKPLVDCGPLLSK